MKSSFQRSPSSSFSSSSSVFGRIRGRGRRRGRFTFARASHFATLLAVLLAAVVSTGCRTAAPLPMVDVSAPGWKVHQGQAVWTPGRGHTDIAGELFLARHTNGDCLVQFTKPPFTIVEARAVGRHWRLEFGSGEKRWRGNGNPPARVVWFELARALSGTELDARWSWTRESDGAWILLNDRTGERLEGWLVE